MQQLWRDISAIGSWVFFLLITFMAYFVGQPFLGTQLLIALACCYAISVPLKLIFFKNRPKKEAYANWFQKFEAATFPSTHAMRIVCLGVLLAVHFSHLLFYAVALGLVVLVTASRVILQKHYVGDVLAGAAFGIIISTLLIYFKPAESVLFLVNVFK